MEIQTIKTYLKNNKITYEQLSERSGIPLNTLKNIFSGRTSNPRIDTMQAIEAALGIEEKLFTEKELSKEEKELALLISQLNEEEVNELSNFVDYIISKRK